MRGPDAMRRRPCVAGPGARGRLAAVGLALAVFALGCLIPTQPAWDARVKQSDVDRACVGLPAAARSAWMPLSKVFYSRITSRRFNSRATFDDPSVRQFFPTVTAYSDYYAALADALDQAYIENNRPTVVQLLSIDRNESGSLQVVVRFTGENDLPLRWWSASLIRTDEWRWQDDRWWVIPGKV